MFTSEEILQQLDVCAGNYTFPMLDNGYVYLAGTRLSAYRDNTRWALIIEVIGFNYRGGGHNGIDNCLHIFGNCLGYEPGTRDENFLFLTDESTEGKTFDIEEEFYLNPLTPSFLLRGQKIPIVHSREKYADMGIELEMPDKINAFEFLRLNANLNYKTFVASEKEIRERIPIDLPMIIQLEEWYHPDTADDELPSKNETFQLLAEVLVTGNSDLYLPTRKPNTHWKNWPMGGTL